jgi:hypothetical protein
MSASRVLGFLLITFGILGSTHYYLWTRLVRDPAWPATWARPLTWALIALAASIPGYFVVARALRHEMPALGWLAFVWMGCFFLLFVTLLAGDLATVLGSLAFRLVTTEPLDAARRLPAPAAWPAARRCSPRARARARCWARSGACACGEWR